ncbi:hypothetical protein FIBSPDRAFT_493688 [Athelia psychrophila]|uniref:Uncharacterized protein n=1 Tax=Athelia psychrophila TaxID=1759441 RepID=A0A167TTB5_9AGAM|nr:hypothetical protein FIBSPDRAFT_493688 [Fibularhizoctonia sp. CBS 109695]
MAAAVLHARGVADCQCLYILATAAHNCPARWHPHSSPPPSWAPCPAPLRRLPLVRRPLVPGRKTTPVSPQAGTAPPGKTVRAPHQYQY